MSKYILLIGLLGFLLASCEKEDILGYQLEEDCIQFDLPSAEMSNQYNFADHYYVKDGISYYTGDSLLCDTLTLPLAIIGWESDVPRAFKLKTLPVVDVDTLPMATVVLDSLYSFNADKLRDTIRVIFMRPEAGMRVGADITFDFESGDVDFDSGAEELSAYGLIVENLYTRSWNWDDSYLGEFTQAKAAFIVTLLQNSLENLGNIGWSNYNATLREALEQYKADHPDVTVDFEFPVNNKPSWWDNQAMNIGVYSEAKNEFMHYYLGDYAERMSMGWDWLSLYLGYYYDNGDYFAKNPSAEKFDNDFRAVTEPDWWASNSSYIGKFSTPKALMLEWMYGSFVWSNGLNRNWQSEALNLQGSYENYFNYITNDRGLTPPEFENDFQVVTGDAPLWWNSAYLGKYSDEKKSFMEAIYDEAGDGKWWTDEAPTMAWGPQIQNLIDWYNRYFPDPSKAPFVNDFSLDGSYVEDKAPDWWQQWIGYLGEYSEGKKNLLMQLCGGDDGEAWWNDPDGAAKELWARKLNEEILPVLSRWGSFEDPATGEVITPDDFYPNGDYKGDGGGDKPDVDQAPTWWMPAALGEYSKDKKEFLESIYDKDGTGEWWESGAASMSWWGELDTLHEYYDRYWPNGEGAPFKDDFAV